MRCGAVALLLAQALTCQADADKPLLVMLQDSDLDPVRALVAELGGQITHELPIIDALGVSLSQQQLDELLTRAPDIDRVIDDLAWEPDPGILSRDGCALAGGLELSWRDATATWTIYNKGEAPIALESISVNWPEYLGALGRVSIGDLALQRSTPNHYVLAESRKLAAHSSQSVALRFDAAPDDPHRVQSQVALSLAAGEDCDIELVPSYTAPDSDSYFPTVSGAALLHSHGVTGDGVAVAVLDSGLWEESPELSLDTRGAPRVVGRYDAINDKVVDQAFDESGHGTHMTSVLARSGATTRPDAPQPSYRGIAPDADIVVVKAFGESGVAGFLDLVRGVQWVVENRERLDIKILNLSFAARPRWPYWQDPLNQALMCAWEAGIFIVAAGGNEGPDSMTIGSPGNLPYLLTVGAFTDSWTESNRNDDYIPDFSSRGPTPLGHIKPDLVAPGGHITGITRPGSSLARQFPEYFLSSGEFVMTGTSQAAALVSGLAALILQLEPDLNNDELKCMFRTSTEPAIDLDGRLAYTPFAQGEGMVSLQRALTLGRKDCDQDNLDLAAELADETHFQGPAVFTPDDPPTLPGSDLLISDQEPDKGPSLNRRWGVIDHLERLETVPDPFPFDWFAVYEEEQRRIKAMAENSPR